jgi:hypothetical protein
MGSGIHRAQSADPGDGFGYSYPISLMGSGIHRRHPQTTGRIWQAELAPGRDCGAIRLALVWVGA